VLGEPAAARTTTSADPEKKPVTEIPAYPPVPACSF